MSMRIEWTAVAPPARASMSESDEDAALRDELRRFLQDDVRADVEADGMDVRDRRWNGLSQEFGLIGVGLSEALGGAGGGAREQAVVLEELGAVLDGSAYLATEVFATQAVLASGAQQFAELHAAWATGERTAAFVGDCSSSAKADSTDEAPGWTLSGTTGIAIDAATADDILVIAETERGSSLFLVRASSAGIRRHRVPMIDQTRAYGTIDFEATPATMLGEAGVGATVSNRVRRYARLALAASQVGGARRCRDVAVAYAQQREQFEQLIGRFQAVKHLTADMHSRVETARTLVLLASRRMDAGTEAEERLDDLAAMAHAWATRSYHRNAQTAIQLHGGIGFTWECEAHLHLKRAAVDRMLMGTPEQAFAELGRRLRQGTEPAIPLP